MPLYVNYDRDGTITSIIEMDPPQGVQIPVLPLSEEHEVVELELDDETRGLDSGELVRAYRIDPATKRLVRRDE